MTFHANDDLTTLLLRTSKRVFLPAASPAHARPGNAVKALRALERRLFELGYVLTEDLHVALRTLDDVTLRHVGEHLTRTLERNVGAHATHVTLFRRFPLTTPNDTFAFYLRRVLTWSARDPGEPCALDHDDLPRGASTHVGPHSAPERACAYGTFDPAEFGGCPICHRRLATPALPAEEASREPTRLRALHLGGNVHVEATALLTRLLSRTTPLSPQDRESLAVLLISLEGEALTVVPDVVPMRETMAFAFTTLLRSERTRDAALAVLPRHLKTATDVLRVIDAYGGGNGTLTEAANVSSMPRALRRVLLGALDSLRFEALVEDLGRHPGDWKRAGEMLHPFEHAARFQSVALAFAVLRGTALRDDALAHRVESAANAVRGTRLSGNVVRYRAWSGDVETAFARHDVHDALRLLRQRPGEFGRRFDKLLREVVAREPALLADVEATARAVAPRLTAPMLLSLSAHLARRHEPHARRVFFPKGDAAHARAIDDTRPLLPHEVTAPFTAVFDAELVRRASALPSFERAVLDEGLARVPVPVAARKASRALVAWPRGAHLDVPPERFLRLFVHWVQPQDIRVDLDLSVAFYDDAWTFVGLCDFTNLRFGAGAVHSGDFTSAPAPEGASEFLDLDVDALRGAGVRYAVPVIFSYNDVAFDVMPEAFAGVMLRAERVGKVFNARSVEQRFDLSGSGKVAAPLCVDFARRTLRWLDVKVKPRGGMHRVGTYKHALGKVVRDVDAHFESGGRATLWDLALVHAAGRAREVLVLGKGGGTERYRRRPEEDAAAFHARVNSRSDADEANVNLSIGEEAVLGAFVRRALELPPGSVAFAVDEGDVVDVHVSRIDSGALLSELHVRETAPA
ncbi:MXAN_6230/SCO0854 family RING domain-containing protein [Deinococcus yavapaiensis]|uniref:Uncharacterized protein n=1 Tax=Deinococcus yavapaiensis KR-236 TaxID=694435 RepID=A0A318SCJ8_9DEIO|nr:MXAN_6230/SCO0854 family RING domain-containing protein [Deinococcus yavapaiensis]PYE49420.1 hypothetical protein DES52_12314 [Deinococcus yavapaiensis KR-236]